MDRSQRVGRSPPSSHLGFQCRPYRPAIWLPGAHLQTLAGKYLRGDPPVAVERSRLETRDGDFLDLDVGVETAPTAPIVLILHGLEGSSRRPYVRVTMLALARMGIRPIGMNFRSCSGEPNRRARFYHSGEIGDLSFVLAELARRFPGRPMGALGFSLGGNVLLRYLGELGERAAQHLSAAVAISVPYDLAEGAVMLETGLMGRSTMVLVRRRSDAKQVVVSVGRVPDGQSLYPLGLEASIPSPAGGTRTTTLVPAWRRVKKHVLRLTRLDRVLQATENTDRC